MMMMMKDDEIDDGDDGDDDDYDGDNRDCCHCHAVISQIVFTFALFSIRFIESTFPDWSV